MVIDPKKLEEIANKVVDSIPPGVKQMAEGVDAKVKQALQHQLSRLDFVSREEFDVQTSVLQRTREKLITLEARLDELEKAKSISSAETNDTKVLESKDNA